MPLQFKTDQPAGKPLGESTLGLSSVEVLAAISRFDTVGLWRMDLNTGLSRWSESTYEVYGWEVTDGPVSLSDLVEAYHPDDRDIVARCLEETASHKKGFRFILRLEPVDGSQRWVKSSGLYRKLPDGEEEIFGCIEQFSALTRSVTVSI